MVSYQLRDIKGYSHKEFVAKWVEEDGDEYRSLLGDGWQAMPVTRRFVQNEFWAIIVWNEREAIEYWKDVHDPVTLERKKVMRPEEGNTDWTHGPLTGSTRRRWRWRR